MRNYKLIIAVSLLAIWACVRDSTSPGGGGHHGPPNPDSLGPGIVATTTVDGKNVFVLSDGQTVFLDDITETEQWLQQYPAPVAPSPSAPARVIALPPSVSLQQYQTAGRSPGPRRTCTTFAGVAAIEAAYRHAYNVSLDLSEEYATRMHNAEAILTPATAPTSHENLVASWGGGSVTYTLQLFSNSAFGLPEEQLLGYLPFADFENTNQGGDVPMLNDNSTQRAVDDFNLSEDAVVYKIPAAVAIQMFRSFAIDSARYRATQVLYASPSDRQSVTWFKTQLAAGHEVAFGARLTKNSKAINGVWMPGDTVFDGHGMLMVGYADSLNAFLIKNSWGTSVGDTGYFWFSYNWVTQSVIEKGNPVPGISDAAVVLAVAPLNSPAPLEQHVLGRWYVDYDGVQGILDIYRVPGLFGQIEGKDDHRIGTYYGPDNIARRVNGTIVGGQLEAYIDLSNSGARPIDDLSGLHFSARLMADGSDDPGAVLAGSVVNNNQTFGFYGHRGSYFTPTPSGHTAGLAAYLGNWKLNVGGSWGTLHVTAIDSNYYTFSGTYTDVNNGVSQVSGLVSGHQPYSFSMTVGNTQLIGYRFNQENSVLAGGGAAGFVAYHYNTPPTIQITYPTANATLDFDLNLLSATALHATVQDAEDGNGCCAVEWDDGSTEVATDANTSYTFSDTGSHTVTAIVSDLDGSTAHTRVTFRLVNNPPTAKILKPTDAQHFITGVTYNAALEAQQWLVAPPKTIAYLWASNSGTDNFPKHGTTPTGVVFGDTGARVITLTVSDNYGLQATSTGR